MQPVLSAVHLPMCRAFWVTYTDTNVADDTADMTTNFRAFGVV